MPVGYFEPFVWGRRDFLLLVGVAPGPEQSERARQAAEEEKAAVAALLRKELGLELSETKTLVTPVTEAFAFLGHHVRVRYNRAFGRTSDVTLIPKERSHRTRERIKRLCWRHRTGRSLRDLLRELNWLLRGWSAFYRHAWGATVARWTSCRLSVSAPAPYPGRRSVAMNARRATGVSRHAFASDRAQRPSSSRNQIQISRTHREWLERRATHRLHA